MNKHLLIDVSAHGYGHLAQVAPVLQALHQAAPAVSLTLRTDLPATVVQARVPTATRLLPRTLDIGMQMASAVDVLPAVSATEYRALHRDWSGRVASEAEALTRLAPDLVLADIPYLSLAAAQAAGVPAVALCSLHWGDIFAHYCHAHADFEDIHGQIMAAYRSAAVFLQPVPHMPMDSLVRRRPVGPLASLGKDRRPELAARIGLAPRERTVLVALGGISTRLPLEDWPLRSTVRWLVPDQWAVNRRDCVPMGTLGLPFADLLASSDLILTKPGYGTFVEAACLGIPVLYVARRDWPEEPHLTAWLQHHGRCLEIAREALWRGDLDPGLEQLWSQPRPEPVAATGAREVSDTLLGLLQGDLPGQS